VSTRVRNCTECVRQGYGVRGHEPAKLKEKNTVCLTLLLTNSYLFVESVIVNCIESFTFLRGPSGLILIHYSERCNSHWPSQGHL